jgi:hypothetical protein
MRLGVSLILLLACSMLGAQNDGGSAVVILLAQFSGFNNYALGTGAFIDHDGLIITADHVVHKITLTLAASSSNAKVNATIPSKLTIFSPYLNQFFDVDPATVVGGQVTPNQWMDAAFLRVKLNDVQRASIQPLDFSTTAPVQKQKVWASGPKCDDSSVSLAIATERCLANPVAHIPWRWDCSQPRLVAGSKPGSS